MFNYESTASEFEAWDLRDPCCPEMMIDYGFLGIDHPGPFTTVCCGIVRAGDILDPGC